MFRRQTAGQWEWEPAKTIAAKWEASTTWGKAALPPQPSEDAKTRISIAEATEAFLAKCDNRGIQPSTLTKYKTFTRQLNAYAENLGYVYLDQLSISDMDHFYASWTGSGHAKKRMDP